MKFLQIVFYSALLTLTACSSRPDGAAGEDQTEVNNNSAQIIENNPAVRTGKIQTRQVAHTIECTGRIDIPPTDVLSVHSRASGFVNSIKYISGDYVRKGAIVATIENPEFITRQRELLETRSRLSLAEKQYQRQANLQEGEATTSKAVDEARANLELLQATYNGLRNELSAIGFDVEALETKGTYQQELKIHASFPGIVESVEVNTGQMITPQDRIMHIISNEHVHVELQVLTRDAPFVELSQRVHFRFPGTNGDLTGEVIKISPAVERGSGTFMVHCHFEHTKAQDYIKPGLFVNARIEAGVRELQGLPQSGIIKEGESYSGYVVEGDTFRKIALEDVEVVDGFATFTIPDGYADAEWIVEGAYYIE